MPIRVACGACGAGFAVADEAAGRRGKCPKCKAPIEVPGGAPTAAAPPPVEDAGAYELVDAAPRAVHEQVRQRATAAGGPAPLKAARAVATARTGASHTPAEILAAFRGEIEPVRPTLLYRLWILIVAVVMVVLPLLYLALVGVVVYGLVYHATHNYTVFQTVRNGKAAVIAYLGPLVAGAIVVAFMIKPLFARPAKGEKTRALDPSKEPLLFAFVDGVCQTVGSPRPARIEVDCQVNASARLSSGPLSRELVLTIGLPLVAGLDLRQFAGVLAHEFGHFAQAAGMRLSYLIRSINHWFARVVYERDEWDQTLAAWSKEGNVYLIVVVGLARIAVWLTRRILWVLMWLGHLVSGFLMRQMEFDADRYQARMVGGPAVGEILWRVSELDLASRGAWADVNQSWNERRLPDDFPRLILTNIPQIPEPVRAAYRSEFETGKTGLFSTHPADKDRLAHALRDDPGEGLFRLNGPATDVFRDFDGLARLLTFELYRGLIGPGITKDQLFPVEQVVANQAVALEGHQAFNRFYLGTLNLLQPLPLPAQLEAPGDLVGTRARVVAAREAMRAGRATNESIEAEWDDAHRRMAKAELARVLLVTGNKAKAKDLELPAAKVEVAESVRVENEARMNALTERRRPFEQACADRLAADLALLQAPAFATRVPDAEILRDEARDLLPCASYLARVALPILPLFYRDIIVLVALLRTIGESDGKPGETLVNACLRASRAMHERLTELKQKLGDTRPYPFEHAQENLSVGRHVLPGGLLPDAQEVYAVAEMAQGAHRRVLELYGRVLGRLAVAAEAVETALGLEPIEVPPSPDAADA